MDKRAFALPLILLIASSLVLPLASAQNETSPYDLILVRNDNMIDYIVALPYSHMFGIPILPVNPQELDPGTIAQLESYAKLGWTKILIIGNSQAISDNVQDQLLELGFSVERIGGKDRTETSVKLAERFFPNGDQVLVVASSSDYGSALAAARWAMVEHHPLVLNQNTTLSNSTKEALERLQPELVVIIGAGLPDDLESQITALGYQTYWIKKDLTITPPTTPVQKETNWTMVILAVIISVATVVPVTVYYAKKKWSANKVPIEVLTEKERIVVKAILEKGGTVKQEELPELTGYSRPTISRIIQELEKKQLVTREKVGKTFIVKLAKEIILRE
ncbi:MAG: cell wall-binding repeat-containing protein [Thermococcus sp.]|nr:cell wall-binding repeat-containing protein [Thermococcus sp.]